MMHCFNRPVLAGMLVALGAGLLSPLPALSQARPGILNEPPYARPGRAPATTTPVTEPPVEALQPPAATLSLPRAQINIVLVNETGTTMTYQVVGDTNERSLAAGETYTLRDLSVPTNVNFYRPDRGPTDVTAEAAAPGELRLLFKRGSSFDVDRTSLTVQASGQVFLN